MMIKKIMPWQVKVFAKLLFGILRIDYRFLKALKLVEHGRMENLTFAESVFERQMKVAIERFPSLKSAPFENFCELGPGDSILSGVIAYTNGFTASHLIDVGNFETTGPDVLRFALKKYGYEKDFDSIDDALLKKSVMKGMRVSYLTTGLDAYKTLDADTITFSYSNTVIQHIAKNEIGDIFAEMFRAHKSHSVSVHSINFSDHFSGGFRNRWVPDYIWESRLIRRSNIYTNRLNLHDILRISRDAGFREYVHSYETVDGIVTILEESTDNGELPFFFNDGSILRATIYLIKI